MTGRRSILCYQIVMPGRKSAFRAAFWPDCYRESFKSGPPDVGAFPAAFRPEAGQEGRLHGLWHPIYGRNYRQAKLAKHCTSTGFGELCNSMGLPVCSMLPNNIDFGPYSGLPSCILAGYRESSAVGRPKGRFSRRSQSGQNQARAGRPIDSLEAHLGHLGNIKYS